MQGRMALLNRIEDQRTVTSVAESIIELQRSISPTIYFVIKNMSKLGKKIANFQLKTGSSKQNMLQ